MAEPRAQQDVLEAIDQKLEVLLGLVMVHGKPQDEQIEILRSRGHDWATIGVIVGLKPDAARKRLDKRPGKPGRKKSGGEEG